jgi:hypothetical protein
MLLSKGQKHHLVTQLLYVNVIIIYSDVRNPDFANDIIYVNVIIIFIAVLFIFPLMFKTIYLISRKRMRRFQLTLIVKRCQGRTINNDNVYINYIVNGTWISNITINNDNVYINYIVNRTWISNVTIDNGNVNINYIVNGTWISNITINNDKVYMNYIVNRTWISNVIF